MKTSERNHSHTPNKCSFFCSWCFSETDFCFYWVENIHSSKVSVLFVLNQIQSDHSSSCEVVKANIGEPFLLPAEKHLEEQQEDSRLYPAARGAAQEVGVLSRSEGSSELPGGVRIPTERAIRAQLSESSRMLWSPSLSLRCRGCRWAPGGRSIAAARGLDGSWGAAVNTGLRVVRSSCFRAEAAGVQGHRAGLSTARSSLSAGLGTARRWGIGFVSVCFSLWYSFPRNPVWRLKKERSFSFASEFHVILEVWNSFPPSLFFLFFLFLFEGMRSWKQNFKLILKSSFDLCVQKSTVQATLPCSISAPTTWMHFKNNLTCWYQQSHRNVHALGGSPPILSILLLSCLCSSSMPFTLTKIIGGYFLVLTQLHTCYKLAIQ